MRERMVRLSLSELESLIEIRRLSVESMPLGQIAGMCAEKVLAVVKG